MAEGAYKFLILSILAALLALTVTSAGEVASGSASVSEDDTERPEVQVDLSVADLAEKQNISLAEAESRLEWQRLLPALKARARNLLGERFGGVWVDPADDDRLKVGVVNPNGLRGAVTAHELARQAVGAAGLDGVADVVGVRNSYRDLEAANDWLGRQLERVNVDAPWPLSTRFRPSESRVFLDLPAAGELTTEQQGVVDVAQRRYAAMLETHTYERRDARLSCDYPFCDKPLRGGIRIINNNGPYECTAAFLARSRSDNQLYQFTAGHCVADRGGNSPWYTLWTDGSRHDIGPRHNWEYSGDGDMAILRVTNPGGWDARAWVNVTSSFVTDANSEYRIQRDATSEQGQRVCATGSFYGKSDCGTVLDLGVSSTSRDGVTVRGLAQSSICVRGGDSGEPVFNYGTALGIMSFYSPNAGNASRVCYPNGAMLYQGIRGAENLMNVNVSHEQP